MKQKIGVIGATGKLGTLLVDQLVADHEEVTAIVRNKGKVTQDVAVLERDLFKLTAADMQPFDVVISAFSAPYDDIEQIVTAMDHLIAILDAGTTRLIVAGSVGPLLVDSTTRVAESDEIEPAYRPMAQLSLSSYKHLEANKTFDWLYMAPPLLFNANGDATGDYYFSGQDLGRNDKGDSYLSYADMASAIIDKLHSKDNHLLMGVYS